MIDFIQKVFGEFPEGYKRKVTIGSENMNTGHWDTFDQNNTEFSELWNACVASSSIPFVFPPHHWNGQVYMDGGTVFNINIDSAV